MDAGKFWAPGMSPCAPSSKEFRSRSSAAAFQQASLRLLHLLTGCEDFPGRREIPKLLLDRSFCCGVEVLFHPFSSASMRSWSFLTCICVHGSQEESK